ncbi:MAG: CoA ester lyase [Variovorax paradoxus]|nr:MAG: CoA ester lyase [Variovorax paradoxus]PZP99628.1 MAG: CoA ester lyase [Variovorax paradoxus]
MTNPSDSRPVRLQRSELAVPAIRKDFFEKAAQGPADVIFLDLEDAVPPELKLEARALAIAGLNEVDWGAKVMAVRVNGLDTPWAVHDIIDVVEACPRLDMILLPKAASAFDVRFVETILASIEQDKGRAKRIGIEVLIETAMGVANVEEIAASSPRLEAMIFGVGDYSISMGIFDARIGAPSPDYAVLSDADAAGLRSLHWNDHWHFAKARIATACRAWGLRPIDGPYVDIGDPQGYRNTAQRAQALGFEGKWAIHPSQAPLANEVFTPSTEVVASARKMMDVIADAQARRIGAVSVDGKLIDMAMVKLADRITRRVELIRQRDAIMPQGAGAR